MIPAIDNAKTSLRR